MFDLFGEFTDGLFTFGRKIGGIALGKKSKEIDQITIRDMKVDDTSAAAGAFALGGHADLADAPAADHEIAFVGLCGEHLLESGVFFIGNQIGDELGEV